MNSTRVDDWTVQLAIIASKVVEIKSCFHQNTYYVASSMPLFYLGDLVDVFYNAGTDDTPLVSNSVPYNTFTGFRIAPE